MCCFFVVLVFLGPRFAIPIWWLMQPVRWQAAFKSFIWPMLGFIFAPWTTMMYVLVYPGGVNGVEWVWIGLGVLFDVMWWAGAAARRRAPGYTGRY
jgi:hypothetical protein